jgi:hypothetical protein
MRYRTRKYPVNGAAGGERGRAPKLADRGRVGHICGRWGNDDGRPFISRDHRGLEQNPAHLSEPAARDWPRADTGARGAGAAARAACRCPASIASLAQHARAPIILDLDAAYDPLQVQHEAQCCRALIIHDDGSLHVLEAGFANEGVVTDALYVK